MYVNTLFNGIESMRTGGNHVNTVVHMHEYSNIAKIINLCRRGSKMYVRATSTMSYIYYIM